MSTTSITPSITPTASPTPVVQTSSQPIGGTDSLREHALRRQISAEFVAMRTAIDQAAPNDEMGKRIDQWQQAFAAAFRTSASAQNVLDAYIYLLQEILRDPLSGAPLDPGAILGSDGHTYSYMTLSVYLIAAPQKVQTRSPLHVDQDTPFSIQPHPPVARHMTTWLQSRGACLYSEAQEHMYKQLLLKHQKLSSPSSVHTQTKISSIVQREKELDLIEEKERTIRQEAFAQRLHQKLTQHKQQLHNAFSPLSTKKTTQTQNHLTKLDAIAEKYRITALTITQKCKDAVNEEKNTIEVLTEKLKISKTSSEQGMEEITQAVQKVSAQDQHSAQELTRRIGEFVEQGFEPLVQHMVHRGRETEAHIEAFGEEDQKRLNLLKRSINDSRREIHDLKERVQKLKQSQDNVAQKIDTTAQQASDLEQGIQETEIAIAEAREREKTQVLSTLLQIGACAFGTWALQSALRAAGFGMQVSLLPGKAGQILRFGANF